jgi:hypothetical protein
MYGHNRNCSGLIEKGIAFRHRCSSSQVRLSRVVNASRRSHGLNFLNLLISALILTEFNGRLLPGGIRLPTFSQSFGVHIFTTIFIKKCLQSNGSQWKN